MKKFAVIVLSLALGRLCWGQGTLSKNGTDWNRQTSVEKLSYVMGFSDGYAHEAIKDSVLLDYLSPLGSKNLTEEQKKELIMLRESVKVINLPDLVTYGQMEGAVDTFYSDYRNAPVCWADATWFSMLSLAGNPPDDRALEMTRKQDASSNCK